MLAKNVILKGKTILVTGVAGFIGANLAKRLLQEFVDVKVVGIDNMNDYYDVRLKEDRLKELLSYSSFTFIKGDISDKSTVSQLFAAHHPQVVVNLAAQAGVRYSITNPDAYIASNLIGFYNILEACRHSYDEGKTAWSIWSMQVRVAFMEVTRKCLTAPMTKWIIQSASMRPLRKAMN